MTPEQASTRAQELKDLLALEANPAFQSVVVKRFEQAKDEHLTGSTKKGSTPEQRAEHIEAYHLALDLLTLVPSRIAKLRKDLSEHESKAGSTTFKTSDALR